MLGALFTIAFLGAAGNGCISPIPCDPTRFDAAQVDPADLAAGSWDLWTDIPRLTGACGDLDGRSLIPEMMQAEIQPEGGDLVHLDIGGVHHEAVLWGDALYAEGSSDTGLASEDAHGFDHQVGLIVEGRVNATDELNGTIYVQLVGDDRTNCEVEARFGAALLTWTEGAPAVCDIPVPLDPEDPVRHPDYYEYEGGYTCM